MKLICGCKLLAYSELYW